MTSESPVRAFDLAFEVDGRWRWHPERGDDGPGDLPAGEPDGWGGTAGPAIGDAHWPRGEATELPMMHVLTVRVPEGYRRRGDDLVAISLFQGEGQFAGEVEYEYDDDEPFRRQADEHESHPRERRMEDLIGGQFALIWLTADEFARGPAAPPEDTRGEDGLPDNEDGGPNAWDDAGVETVRVRLVARDDPNAGLTPEEAPADESPYADPFTRHAGELDLAEWARPLAGRSHFGGTPFPAQAFPEGLTPCYLGLEEMLGMNLAGRVAHVDLEDDEVFDWG